MSLWVSSCFCVQICFFNEAEYSESEVFTWKLKLLGYLDIEALETIQMYFKYSAKTLAY